MGRSSSASAHPQLPGGCLAQGQSPIWEGGPGTPGLTFVVLDQLLQRVEVVSWGDVEATAVQSPDLVMLHCPAPQLIPVPHRQRVRAWAGRGELAAPTGAHSCCTWPSRCSWDRAIAQQSQQHPSHCAATTPSAPGQLRLHPKHPKQPQRNTSPYPCLGVWTCGSTTGYCRGTSSKSMGPPSPSLQHSRSPGLGRELLFQAKVDEGSPLGSCSPPRCCGHPSTPFVVSLSLIMKDPIMFPGPRRCRSASFRLMSLKNHLQQNQMNQGMLVWGRAGGRE